MNFNVLLTQDFFLSFLEFQLILILIPVAILHPETAKEFKVYSQFNSELRTTLEYEFFILSVFWM